MDTTAEWYIYILQAVSLFSVCCSVTVVITALAFKSLRSKLFMNIIAFISLSDALANASYLSTTRNSGTVWCSVQAFLQVVFYPSSWLWSTLLVYFLFCIARTGKLPLSMTKIILICFGIPLVFGLLELTFAKYEREDDDFPSYQTCQISLNNEVNYAYHAVTFYGIWWCCLFGMLYMNTQIVKVLREKDAMYLQTLQLAYESLQIYPRLMLIFWLPHFFAVLLSHSLSEEQQRSKGIGLFLFITVVLAVLHGPATAVTFFSKSGEARKKWYYFFTLDLPSLCDAEMRNNKEYLRLNGNQMFPECDFSMEYDESDDGSVIMLDPDYQHSLFASTTTSSVTINTTTNKLLGHNHMSERE